MNNFFDIFNQLPIRFLEGLIMIFGLMIGSFATLLSERLVSKEPILFARSKCLQCQTSLSVLSLVPIFSYLFQRGKCKNCGEKISWQYPAIEAFFAIGFLLSFWSLGSKINAQILIYFAIFLVLALMIIIDLRHYFIPDLCQYLLMFLVMTLLYFLDSKASMADVFLSGLFYLGFSLLLWLIFHFLANIEAIGIDDLKFFFIVGCVLGTINFIIFILLCGVLGSVFGGFWQKFRQDETFPFAPAICSALYLCLLFAKNLNGVVF